jgi:hypothetical protein
LTDRPQALSQGDQALGVEEERPFHATFEVVAQEIEASGLAGVRDLGLLRLKPQSGAASTARVLRSRNGGRTWVVSATPLPAGPSPGAGVLSVLSCGDIRRWLEGAAFAASVPGASGDLSECRVQLS